MISPSLRKRINYFKNSTAYLCIIDFDTGETLLGHEHSHMGRNILKNFGGKWNELDDDINKISQRDFSPNLYNTCLREFVEEIYGFNDVRDTWDPAVLKDLVRSDAKNILKKFNKNIQAHPYKKDITITMFICNFSELENLLQEIPDSVHNFLNPIWGIFNKKPLNIHDLWKRQVVDEEISRLAIMNLYNFFQIIGTQLKGELDFDISVKNSFKAFMKDKIPRFTKLYTQQIRPGISNEIKYFMKYYPPMIEYNDVNKKRAPYKLVNTTYKDRLFKTKEWKSDSLNYYESIISDYFTNDLLMFVELFIYNNLKTRSL